MCVRVCVRFNYITSTVRKKKLYFTRRKNTRNNDNEPGRRHIRRVNGYNDVIFEKYKNNRSITRVPPSVIRELSARNSSNSGETSYVRSFIPVHLAPRIMSSYFVLNDYETIKRRAWVRKRKTTVSLRRFFLIRQFRISKRVRVRQ